MPPDVLILGAGVAGLAAAIDLSRAGQRVEIIEARDRIGGRVLTQFDPSLHHPVELGAEFVHGFAPEIWQPLQRRMIHITGSEGDFWCSSEGRLRPCDFFGGVDDILKEMDTDSPDESFVDFLGRRFAGSGNEEAKRHAIGYVSGFNAADPNQVSVHWLAHSRDADEKIQGDRAFHIRGGYRELLKIFADELSLRKVTIHLSTIVEKVGWKRGSVQISTRSPHGNLTFSAPRTLVTFPLAVLQRSVEPGGLEPRFEPALRSNKLEALGKLAMGKVVRVTLCFRHRVWEDVTAEGKTFANMSFLISDNQFFPTWWTQMPDPAPVITGWAPAHSAELLTGMPPTHVIDKALGSLSDLLNLPKAQIQAELVSSYFHDWDADPFSLGAYSYVKVGGEGCQQVLGSPLDNTLFFGGEATDTSGHNGTVHGAIASGKRAAKEMLDAR